MNISNTLVTIGKQCAYNITNRNTVLDTNGKDSFGQKAYLEVKVCTTDLCNYGLSKNYDTILTFSTVLVAILSFLFRHFF